MPYDDLIFPGETSHRILAVDRYYSDWGNRGGGKHLRLIVVLGKLSEH